MTAIIEKLPDKQLSLLAKLEKWKANRTFLFISMSNEIETDHPDTPIPTVLQLYIILDINQHDQNTWIDVACGDFERTTFKLCAKPRMLLLNLRHISTIALANEAVLKRIPNIEGAKEYIHSQTGS